MARLNWTQEAETWLRDIYEYIAQDNPVAAARVVEGIYERAQVLARFPKSVIDMKALQTEKSAFYSTDIIVLPICTLVSGNSGGFLVSQAVDRMCEAPLLTSMPLYPLGQMYRD